MVSNFLTAALLMGSHLRTVLCHLKLTNWWLQPDKFHVYTCHWQHEHTIVTTLQPQNFHIWRYLNTCTLVKRPSASVIIWYKILMREITTNQQSKILMSNHLMNWIIHTNRVSGIKRNRNLQNHCYSSHSSLVRFT